MKTAGLSLVATTLLLMALAPAAAPKAENKAAGVFAPLERGQTVSLKEVGGRYEVGIVPGVELSHRVVEVGPDFLVVDVAGVMETRIPLYSIRAVTVSRVPKK